MWRSWVRGALLVLSVILTLSLLYLLATRTESVPRVEQAALGRDDAGIDDFTFMHSKGGSVQWHVQAERAHMVEADHRAVLENVEVTLYGHKGWELKLKGDEGTIDTGTKNFTLVRHEGTIPVELQNGYTIYTNHLMWQDERGEVSTGDPVTIVGDGLEIQGRGLIGKLESEEFRILHDVQVHIRQ